MMRLTGDLPVGSWVCTDLKAFSVNEVRLAVLRLDVALKPVPASMLETLQSVSARVRLRLSVEGRKQYAPLLIVPKQATGLNSLNGMLEMCTCGVVTRGPRTLSRDWLLLSHASFSTSGS
jgi:hypothetical protein